MTNSLNEKIRISNPLELLTNLVHVQYTIKDGVVYKASTLDTVWPVATKRPVMSWCKQGVAGDGDEEVGDDI